VKTGNFTAGDQASYNFFKGLILIIYNMRIAIIGYGRMGQEIHKTAMQRGHEIKLVIDKDNRDDLNSKHLEDIDVAIEFSQPESAATNILTCLNEGVPVVSGTTGWLERFGEVSESVRRLNGTFLYASNFSIGVNILFSINRQLALLMEKFNDYTPSITEIHHTRKLDAPSGTAITLAGDISSCTGWDGWTQGVDPDKKKIRIDSVREGDVTGIHEIDWISETDKISIRHEAFNRSGFAIGAVFAAEFASRRKGLLTMSDLLGI